MPLTTEDLDNLVTERETRVLELEELLHQGLANIEEYKTDWCAALEFAAQLVKFVTGTEKNGVLDAVMYLDGMARTDAKNAAWKVLTGRKTNDRQNAFARVAAWSRPKDAELVDVVSIEDLSTVLRHILEIIDFDYHKTGAYADIKAAIDKIDTPF